MAHRIVSVDEGSVAEALGIEPGDELFSINGECVIDLLDYQALSCESRVRMCVRRSAEEVEYEFEKDEYEPLGLGFSTSLMSRLMREVRTTAPPWHPCMAFFGV